MDARLDQHRNVIDVEKFYVVITLKHRLMLSTVANARYVVKRIGMDANMVFLLGKDLKPNDQYNKRSRSIN